MKLQILACAVSISWLTGCVVPQNRYDEVEQKLHGEQAARAATALELEHAKAELAKVNQALGTREENLTVREGELAQTKLDADRMTTERDDAVLLVEQLRGELARVGSNLQEFSQQKRDLEAALAEADDRAKRLDRSEQSVDAKVLLARDVSVALGDAVTTGKVVVSSVGGKPVIRFPARDVFAETGSELLPSGAALLAKLAPLLASRQTAHVELADRSADAVSPEDRIVRLQHVADALGMGPDRVGVGAPPEQVPGEQAVAKDGPGGLEIVVELAAAS